MGFNSGFKGLNHPLCRAFSHGWRPSLTPTQYEMFNVRQSESHPRMPVSGIHQHVSSPSVQNVMRVCNRARSTLLYFLSTVISKRLYPKRGYIRWHIQTNFQYTPINYLHYS